MCHRRPVAPDDHISLVMMKPTNPENIISRKKERKEERIQISKTLTSILLSKQEVFKEEFLLRLLRLLL